MHKVTAILSIFLLVGAPVVIFGPWILGQVPGYEMAAYGVLVSGPIGAGMILVGIICAVLAAVLAPKKDDTSVPDRDA